MTFSMAPDASRVSDMEVESAQVLAWCLSTQTGPVQCGALPIHCVLLLSAAGNMKRPYLRTSFPVSMMLKPEVCRQHRISGTTLPLGAAARWAEVDVQGSGGGLARQGLACTAGWLSVWLQHPFLRSFLVWPVC